MSKTTKKPSENFLAKIIRQVVKEEIAPVEARLKADSVSLRAEMIGLIDRLVKEVVGMRTEVVGMRNEVVGMRNEVVGMKDEILTSNDKIAGEIKDMREEYEILQSGHHRIITLEEDMEKMKNLHPHGQHIPA